MQEISAEGGLVMEKYLYSNLCETSECQYDVIVAGGGTAGCIAAIAAVMEGARTLLIEKNIFLGGTATGGQVTPMMSPGIPEEAELSYINKLVKKRLLEQQYGAADPCGNDGWFNPEMLKFTAEDIYMEQGGRLLYDTQIIDTIVENRTIKGLVIYNKGGLQAVKGKVIIDCSGDAVVAHSAGVPCLTGDDIMHQNQASSLRFMVGNVDIPGVLEHMKRIGEPMVLEYPFMEIASVWDSPKPLTGIFQKAVEDGVLTYDDGKYFQAFSVPGMPGVVSFNCPEIPGIYNTLDPDAITGIAVTGKKMISRLYTFLKKYIGGFENSYILSVASVPGIRESRRIKGKYVLTEEDYNNRAKFDDAIARTAYPVDIHGLIDEKKLDVRPFQKGEYFEIPLRCLVTGEIDNLLVGGRCISSSFVAQSSVRIQATCRATGEAAGIAAAYCSKEGITVGELDGKIVREKMLAKSL